MLQEVIKTVQQAENAAQQKNEEARKQAAQIVENANRQQKR